MKKSILIALLAIILAACNADKTREFIPGTYINTAEGEYSIAHDTLVIEPSESNSFYIQRKTGFRIIRDGKPGKLEYETEKWNTLYDEATKSLSETRKGKLITFYPDGNKLMVGKREYKKTRNE